MHFFARTRLLSTALFITALLLLGAALLIGFSVNEQGEVVPSSNAVLAQQIEQSSDECVVCHTNHTPGIVNQYGQSAHFQNNVSCADCHSVEGEEYPGAVKHPDGDFYVLAHSSTEKCETCHREQVQQYNLSRHGLPAFVAYAGKETLTEEQLALYESIPEGGYATGAESRNAIARMEGHDFTPFTCETCHDVGKPNLDGSVGDCSTCHIRHEFSLEQVRKPETCNACHIGPDHPQWEIYVESSHGIAYATGGDDWNWEAEPGTLTTVDFPAPTCATCHMSGFGSTGTTHDVGDRLGWFLAAPITAERPNHAENRARMQNVCLACHSNNFVDEFYTGADLSIDTINDFVRLSDAIIKQVRDAGLLTENKFDEPIEYVHYEIWHHYGRTAKSGVWMQGADYAQWHGVYEIMKHLAELRALADEKLVDAGLPPLDLPDSFPSIDAAREYLAQLEGSN